MKKYGFKGLVFPVVGYIGKFNNWDITFGKNNKSLHLSKIQIRDLHLNGWEIGSHGMTHKAFTLMPKHELRKELIESKSILENIIDSNITKITPPFSSISKSIIKLIQDCDYTHIYYQPNFLEKYNEKGMIKRHTIYSIDNCKSIQRKLNNSVFELIKESIIHKCSRLTILFKEIL